MYKETEKNVSESKNKYEIIESAVNRHLETILSFVTYLYTIVYKNIKIKQETMKIRKQNIKYRQFVN